MRRIALEEHFVMDSPAHLERWRSLIPNIPPAAVEKIKQLICDVGERRIEAMHTAGIDFAVLSNVGSVQGELDGTVALKLAREANDFLAATVQRHPAHFAGFATVALQDPAAGASELDRAVRDLGMKGALIIGHTNGLYLDDDRFSPFWERAAELALPVYLHASDPRAVPPTYAGRPELIGATWSWTAETAAHALRLVFGRVFTRFPGVRLALGHMGETLPYLLWRLDTRAKAFSGTDAVAPGDVIRRNIVVTTAGLCSNEALACALASLGEDAVMFSVDHPFESMTEASAWLDGAPVQESVREKISCTNASRLLKLS